MKSLSATIQMKATEQYFPVVLFIMLCKVALTFVSVNKFQLSVSCLTFFKMFKQQRSWIQ